MKHYQGTRIVSLFAVFFSVALLVFLCIWPAQHTKAFVERIVSLSDDCLTAIKQEDKIAASRIIAEINACVESETVLLKMFYLHDDINALENAAHRALSIFEECSEDVSVTLPLVCDIREAAENITERDKTDLGAFI